MKGTTTKSAPGPADAARLLRLAAGAADVTRVSGTSLAAGLDADMADAAQLEASRLRFKLGKEAGAAAAGRAEAQGGLYHRRAESLRAEAETGRKHVEAEFGREPPGSSAPGDTAGLVLEVTLVRGKRPLPEHVVELYDGKEVLDSKATDAEGRAVFEIARPAGKAEKRLAKSAPTTPASRALRLVALSPKGETVAQRELADAFEAGRPLRVTLDAGSDG